MKLQAHRYMGQMRVSYQISTSVFRSDEGQQYSFDRGTFGNERGSKQLAVYRVDIHTGFSRVTVRGPRVSPCILLLLGTM